MLYWGFAVENARGESFAGHRDLMTSPDLPKPILSAHELLCRMDETALPLAGARPGAALGAFAAGGKARVQILAYHFDETDLDAEGPGASGTLTVCGLNPGQYGSAGHGWIGIIIIPTGSGKGALRKRRLAPQRRFCR